jgi:hypothetical protein
VTALSIPFVVKLGMMAGDTAWTAGCPGRPRRSLRSVVDVSVPRSVTPR